MGLAPVAGYVFGKTGKALGILSDNCYVAGTDVMVGNLEGGDNPFSQKDIEDIRVGDLVWSRDENDPDAPLELKPVTEVYRHVAYDLQSLTLTDLDGERQTLDLTDEHPMYVQGQGWTLAVDLKIGDKILSDDGTDLVVTGNTDFKPAGGMAVYNFAVEGDHTYFVNNTNEATVEGESWAWTHNTCVYVSKLEVKQYMLVSLRTSGIGSFNILEQQDYKFNRFRLWQISLAGKHVLSNRL